MAEHYWDIFQPPAEESQTTYRQWVETKTEPTLLATGDGSVGAPFKQTNPGVIKLINRDLDSWLLPGEGKIQCKFRVVLANGQSMPDGDADPVHSATLINGGWNLFKDSTLKINGKQVDRVDYPGRVQLMNGYASYSNQYVEQVGEQEWFYRPTSKLSTGVLTFDGDQRRRVRRLTGFANSWANLPVYVDNDVGVLPDFAAAQAAINATRAINKQAIRRDGIATKENTSFYSRSQRTRGSKLVEVWLPLSAVHGFCKENKKAIRGVQLELELDRNEEWDSIIHSQLFTFTSYADDTDDGAGVRAAVAAGAYKVVLDSVSLWMPQVKPSLAMASQIETQLAENAKTQYVYSNMTMYRSEEYNAADQANLRWSITSTAHKPLLALVAFQHSAQYNQCMDKADLIYGTAANTVAQTAALYAAALPTDPAGANTPRPRLRPQLASAAGDLFSALEDIVSVEFRVSGRIVPNETYNLSFLTEDYKRAYLDFLDVYKKDDAETSSKIYDEFVYRDSPIFAFPLHQIGDEGLYNNIKTSDLEVRVNVRASSAADVPATGSFSSGRFTIYCMLMTEVVANVEARSGRLSIMP
jgi:hypothetical protein